ncbi:unnamed protein product [Arctogadus glacialis]
MGSGALSGPCSVRSLPLKFGLVPPSEPFSCQSDRRREWPTDGVTGGRPEGHLFDFHRPLADPVSSLKIQLSGR